MRYYKIIFFAAMAFTVLSCKKLLEIKETNFIGGDIALKTVANNEQGIIGAYAGLGTEMDILLNATFSDEVKKAEFYNSATTHEWQYTSTDITIRDNFTAFPYFYKVIDRVNRVLQALPKADSTKAGDETLRARLRGEALFLRAFCHFELYRYYCLNYDPNALALAYMEVPSLEPKARITQGPYFTKLNADIADAKNLLPSALTDVQRATKFAAAGLQARVALYMKDWTNAAAYSTEYITGLALSPRAAFNGIWTDANNNEIAFKLRRNSGNRIGSLFRGTSSKSAQGDTLVGTITWAPTDALWNSFDQANDIRFSSYFKDEPLLVKQGRPSHMISKYAGTGYTSAGENIADGKVFRTGEMYLIRAEAKAELNDLAGAAADINALRTARITGYSNIPTYASKDAAITDILQERFKELAYEGNRFWDLKRRGLPVQRTGSDAPTTTAATLPANNFRFLLPIPNSEIQANKLIEQNPGYTN